jgi:hypothetical protein
LEGLAIEYISALYGHLSILWIFGIF